MYLKVRKMCWLLGHHSLSLHYTGQNMFALSKKNDPDHCANHCVIIYLKTSFKNALIIQYCIINNKCVDKVVKSTFITSRNSIYFGIGNFLLDSYVYNNKLVIIVINLYVLR